MCKKTGFVAAGAGAGSKLTKAEQLGYGPLVSYRVDLKEAFSEHTVGQVAKYA